MKLIDFLLGTMKRRNCAIDCDHETSLDASKRLGLYVKSGKLVDVDPFKLNDPTIKKEKELDEEEITNSLLNLRKQHQMHSDLHC